MKLSIISYLVQGDINSDKVFSEKCIVKLLREKASKESREYVNSVQRFFDMAEALKRGMIKSIMILGG
jgi:hypothetical protein